MSKPAKWSFGDSPPAPEPQEWPDTETYEDQQAKSDDVIKTAKTTAPTKK